MEILWFLRPRFCIRYLHILLTFTAFTVFLVFFHQFRPKGAEYGSGGGGGLGATGYGSGSVAGTGDHNHQQPYQHHFGGFFAGLRAGGGYWLRGAMGGGNGGNEGGVTTGVLPIVYGHMGSGGKTKKKCSSPSTGGDDEVSVLLQSVLQVVGRARYDNRRLVRDGKACIFIKQCTYFLSKVFIFFAVENS